MSLKIDGVSYDPITTAERNALVSPAKGLTIYNSDTSQLESNHGTPGVPSWGPSVPSGGGSGAPTLILPFIEVNSNSTTYATLGVFIFPGTGVTGVPTKINALVRRNGAATSVNLRIYDVTNAQVIAELTGITNLNADIISGLGALANLPVGEAKFEVQGLRVGGPGGARVFFNGLEIRL